MDDWEKFNEASLPEEEDFWSHFSMEHITDAGYTHAERVSKDFEIKKPSRISCSKQFIIASWCIWDFLSAPGLAQHAGLKKTKVKLDLLTDIDMLLMV